MDFSGYKERVEYHFGAAVCGVAPERLRLHRGVEQSDSNQTDGGNGTHGSLGDTS